MIIDGVGTVTVAGVRYGTVHLRLSCLSDPVVLPPGRAFTIGPVTIVNVGERHYPARLGFDAPQSVRIKRGELCAAPRENA